MNLKKNEVIKFNNGEYLILDLLSYQNNTYLYLINNAEYENDVSIVKVLSENGITKYTYIDDDEEFNYVLNKLFLNYKDEITDFLVEE